MRNVLTIIKKEFIRFFKDKRLVITVLMPGFLIYAVYSIMGAFIDNNDTTVSTGKYSAYVVNMPTDNTFSDGFYRFVTSKDGYTFETAKTAVEEGELDLVIVFSDNFNKVLGGEETGGSVEIYHNSAKTRSNEGYTGLSAYIELYNTHAFDINAGDGYDLADMNEFFGQIYAMILPLVMFALIASGCVAIAPESIAGEKERGTIATLLITPIKRWQLALGKVLSTSCIAMLSGISSFIGLVLSLPKLMAGVPLHYSFGQYALLLLLILSVVFVIITVFSILSTFAKSVKEAGTMIAPVMILLILLGVVPLAITAPALGLYAIPLLGSALGISSVLTYTAPPIGLVLSIISNVVTAGILVIVISCMFNDERIMFNN